MEEKRRRGIFVPEEFNGKGLSLVEKHVLAIIKYYTEEGNLGCCMLSNNDISDIMEVHLNTVKRTFKTLKERGLISTTGGTNDRKTYYIGFREDQNEPSQEDQNEPNMAQNEPTLGTKMSLIRDQNEPYKKEKEEKQDFKEEIKEELKKEGVPVTPMHVKEKTNFDVIMENRQLVEFNKPELVEYLKQNHSDIINQINNSDISVGMIVDSIINVIKKKLTPLKYSDNSDDKKEEQKSNITKIFDEKQDNELTKKQKEEEQKEIDDLVGLMDD